MTRPSTTPLTLAQRLRIVHGSKTATRQLEALLGRDVVSPEDVSRLLARGAVLPDLFPDERTSRTAQKKKAWEAAIRIGNRAVFEALLDADAQAPSPLQKEPDFVHFIAADAPVSFLDALIERKFPLDTEVDSGNMRGNALIGVVARGQDEALDRLLDRGVRPHPPKLVPDHTSDKDMIARWLPPSLLHLARTPHAVRRLVAAGVPVDLENGNHQTALESFLDRANVRHGENQTTEEQVLAVSVAMVEAGVPLAPRDQCTSWRHRQCALVRAAERDLPGVVHFLAQRGATWPEKYPPRPSKVAELTKLGVSLDWARRGSRWLRSWISENDGRDIRSDERAFLELIQQGHIDLNARDPQTGFLPVATAARAGEPETLLLLLKLGAQDVGCPSASWYASWKDACADADEQGHDGDNLLSRIGHDPSLAAEAAQWLLDRKIGAAEEADRASKPRL